jgi:hypothetical protein
LVCDAIVGFRWAETLTQKVSVTKPAAIVIKRSFDGALMGANHINSGRRAQELNSLFSVPLFESLKRGII